MQTTRRPLRRDRAENRRARGGLDAVGLAVHRVLRERAGGHGPERVEPDAQLDLHDLAARPACAAHSAGVKCRPAVGAAALPGRRA